MNASPDRGLPAPTRLAAALSIAFASAMSIAATVQVPSHAPGASTATDARLESARQHYALRMAQRAERMHERSPWRERSKALRHISGTVLPVTNCADDGSDGTLRSVIAGAGEGDTIDLSALACSTITLTQGPIDLSVLGDHHINDLSIIGPGADVLTIDGNNDRVLTHGDFQIGLGTLAISDLTIAHGNYTHGLASCLDSSGNIELTRSVVTDCRASNGGPLTFGGAVSAAYLTMTSSTISDSRSDASGDNVAIGGGAYVSGNATLIDSTISGNAAEAQTPGDGTFYITAGGGLYVRGGLAMTRSTVADNALITSDFFNGPGGGIFVRADAEIRESTFDTNLASNGGGLYKAVFSHYGDPGTTLEIWNSTISANGAYYGGGGMVTLRPTIIANSTIAANSAGLNVGGLWCRSACSLDLGSSIVARNFYGEFAGQYFDIRSDTAITIAGASNLVMHPGENVTLPADTRTDDPLLQPLSDNGGPTATMPLGEGSPAIDAGNNNAGLDFDQRGEGFPRVSGAAADIGAFEVQQPDDDEIFANGFE
jgi:hypothetical protein